MALARKATCKVGTRAPTSQLYFVQYSGFTEDSVKVVGTGPVSVEVHDRDILGKGSFGFVTRGVFRAANFEGRAGADHKEMRGVPIAVKRFMVKIPAHKARHAPEAATEMFEAQANNYCGIPQSYAREINAYAMMRDLHVIPVFCFNAATLSYAMPRLDCTLGTWASSFWPGDCDRVSPSTGLPCKGCVPDVFAERLLGACVQLSCGLSSIHRLAFVHRDIKPSNVLCHSATNTFYIGDMGSCVPLRADDFAFAADPHHTGKAARNTIAVCTDTVTTLWFCSPETLLSKSMNTSAEDVWSLGVSLCDAVLGLSDVRSLFMGDDVRSVFEMQLSIMCVEEEQVRDVLYTYGYSAKHPYNAAAWVFDDVLAAHARKMATVHDEYIRDVLAGADIASRRVPISESGGCLHVTYLSLCDHLGAVDELIDCGYPDVEMFKRGLAYVLPLRWDGTQCAALKALSVCVSSHASTFAPPAYVPHGLLLCLAHRVGLLVARIITRMLSFEPKYRLSSIQAARALSVAAHIVAAKRTASKRAFAGSAAGKPAKLALPCGCTTGSFVVHGSVPLFADTVVCTACLCCGASLVPVVRADHESRGQRVEVELSQAPMASVLGSFTQACSALKQEEVEAAEQVAEPAGADGATASPLAPSDTAAPPAAGDITGTCADAPFPSTVAYNVYTASSEPVGDGNDGVSAAMLAQSTDVGEWVSLTHMRTPTRWETDVDLAASCKDDTQRLLSCGSDDPGLTHKRVHASFLAEALRFGIWALRDTSGLDVEVFADVCRRAFACVYFDSRRPAASLVRQACAHVCACVSLTLKVTRGIGRARAILTKILQHIVPFMGAQYTSTPHPACLSWLDVASAECRVLHALQGCIVSTRRARLLQAVTYQGMFGLSGVPTSFGNFAVRFMQQLLIHSPLDYSSLKTVVEQDVVPFCAAMSRGYDSNQGPCECVNIVRVAESMVGQNFEAIVHLVHGILELERIAHRQILSHVESHGGEEEPCPTERCLQCARAIATDVRGFVRAQCQWFAQRTRLSYVAFVLGVISVVRYRACGVRSDDSDAAEDVVSSCSVRCEMDVEQQSACVCESERETVTA